MKLPQSLTTVTPLSKFLALFLFILFPLVGFKTGMDYENIINPSVQNVIQLTPHVTPSPQVDMSDWKTYRNDKYGFEFKYPSDWNIDRVQGSTNNFTDEELAQMDSVSIGKIIEEEKIGMSFGISANMSRMGKSVSCRVITDPQCLKQYFDSLPTPSFTTFTVRTIPAIRFSEPVLDQHVITTVFVENFTLITFTDNTYSQNGLADKILSTFRFLDNNESVNPTSSKQKQCDEYGGKWINQYNECEGLNTFQCKDAGGTFNECASNCRHDPDYPNVYCIQLCIPVCTF
jgi:hypothetical protein